MDIPPNQTLYLSNLYEKLRKEGTLLPFTLFIRYVYLLESHVSTLIASFFCRNEKMPLWIIQPVR